MPLRPQQVVQEEAGAVPADLVVQVDPAVPAAPVAVAALADVLVAAAVAVGPDVARLLVPSGVPGVSR